MFKSQKQFFFLAVSIQLMLIWLLLFWLGRFNFSAFTLDTFVSIVRNAFRIDISSICYMLFFPFLLSVLYRIIGGRAWGSLFKIYFYVVSVFVVLLNAVDVCLYQEWGAKINARIFLYV